MRKEIELLTTDGMKTMAFEANGATAIRFRQVFHEDLMKKLAGFGKLLNDPNSDDIDYELPSKMAYIMNASGEKRDMKALTEEGFYEWIEQFEGDTLWLAQNEFSEIYAVNQTMIATAKK